jgi:predicted TIM-barrel fold metal-dependent hydrolase
VTAPGGIDCDIHPSVPSLKALLPYVEDHWRDIIETRGMDELNSISYPANSPLTARADWRPAKGKPAATLQQVRSDCLDVFGTSIAICNCLYGVQLLFSEDMAAAFARAVNNWIASEWLDPEPRLRASIVVPIQNVEMAVDEIERCARDPRFVQVLLLASGDHPLGRRHYWPIYAAAERHGLPIGIHAGSSYHNPPTAVGWPSYYTEDYVAQAQAFQSQLTSLICEGVFSRHPNLKVVLLESGWTWLPAHLWRLTKYWRGLRMEVPWVDRPPDEIVRSNIRLSLQPTDAPPTAAGLARIIDHMQSDELLLFSTDYPHWQFDGEAVIPPGLSPDLVRKIMVDNPRATYARLLEPVR